MKPLRVIIVDRTRQHHQHLTHLLQKHDKEVVVSGVGETFKEAVSLVKKVNPDLVFLDIELPDGSGFDLFEHFKPVPFKVVFTMGHRGYAYQAAKFRAVDLLLKPINPEELAEAIKKALKNPVDEQYQQQIGGIHQQNLDPDKIVLIDSNGFQIIRISEIIYLEANGNYTDLFLTGNRKMTYCRILKEFSALLKDHKVIKRTHRSYIVNLNHITSFSNEGTIKLREGHSASLGDSYRDDFLSSFRRY
jgi:two-component system LytT family response regulator